MENADMLHLNRRNAVSLTDNTKGQNERQNKIIHSIAMELRTPVTVMKSNIQLLKKFCRGIEQSFVEESFSLCEDSVDNILRFIDCVKFLSDADQGKFEVKKIRFNVGSFISQMMEELNHSNFDVTRIHVQIAVSTNHIITDKYLLNRIMINLLGNALKFSPSIIELFVSQTNHQLTVLVRDYGIGIPAEEIAEIFNPFVRASNVKMISGTGLGLSIVSKSVTCLEGAVSVSSMEGKGAEFKVVIPLEPDLKRSMQGKKSNQLIPQL